jgi:Arc/MetJ-type ribon-helix-helix transcriptional regulator
MPAKSHQISVRLLRETDAWLERRAGGHVNKADFIRRLIEKEMEKEREENLLEMFNKAAADLTEGDHAEREELLGAFHANEEQAPSKRKGGR